MIIDFIEFLKTELVIATQSLTSPPLTEVVETAHSPSVQMPYAHIGETILIPQDTKTRSDRRYDSAIHVWTKEYGRESVSEYLEALKDHFHQVVFEIGGSKTEFYLTTFRIYDDPDEEYVNHGVIRFEARTFD